MFFFLRFFFYFIFRTKFNTSYKTWYSTLILKYQAKWKNGLYSVSHTLLIFIKKTKKDLSTLLINMVYIHLKYKWKQFVNGLNIDTFQKSDKNYKRFSCDQPVGLRHAGYVIFVESVKKVTITYTIALSKHFLQLVIVHFMCLNVPWRITNLAILALLCVKFSFL